MATPGHQRLDALTSLRFFAALHVVFLHGGARLFHGAPRWMENVRACGYASVSFFFVLSGFILTYNYVDPAKSAPLDVRRFLVARVSRIYPVYLLALVFLGAVSVATFGPLFVTTQVASGLASVALVQAWIPSYAMRWNFPGWSISTEAFFYVAFPLVAAVLRRSVRARVLVSVGLLAWAASLGIASFGLLLQPQPGTIAAGDWAIAFAAFPLARLPELVAGACLGRIFVGDRAAGIPRDGTRMAIAGLAGTFVVYAASGDIPVPLLQGGLLVPFFALTIAGFAYGAGPLGRALAHPALVTLGDASYSLYILQIPVALLVLLLAGKPPVLSDMGAGLFGLDLLLLVLGSLLTFRFVERPLQATLRDRLARHQTREASA